MTMTKEERAVVQAAIEYCRLYPGRVNGMNLAHAVSEYHGVLQSDDATCEASQPIWVPRMWVDVRTGDDVRLPGTENYAHVHRAVHLHWHVDPRTGTSSFNPPQPMEWSGVQVTLYTANGAINGELNISTTQASEFTMDPTQPVEIKTTQTELDAIELLGGWPARVGVITEETNPLTS